MILEMKDIKKSFGDKLVLDGLSLRVEGGHALGLLGRNGAGKTTAIRILMNVFLPDGGSVLLDGAPIDRAGVGVGYLPEERGLYPRKKVFAQLVYLARLKGLSRKDAEKEIDRWLERLGMSEYKNRRLDTLSKGNQQKIQLITALAHDPRLIVLDEPFSGLDPVNAGLLKEIVKEQIEKGKIVIFSSHQMSSIEEFCDDIAIINGGKIVVGGNIAQIKRGYPRNRLAVRTADRQKLYDEFGAACGEGARGETVITLADPSDKTSVIKRVAEICDVDEVRVCEPTLADIFVEYASCDVGGAK